MYNIQLSTPVKHSFALNDRWFFISVLDAEIQDFNQNFKKGGLVVILKFALYLHYMFLYFCETGHFYYIASTTEGYHAS